MLSLAHTLVGCLAAKCVVGLPPLKLPVNGLCRQRVSARIEIALSPLIGAASEGVEAGVGPGLEAPVDLRGGLGTSFRQGSIGNKHSPDAGESDPSLTFNGRYSQIACRLHHGPRKNFAKGSGCGNAGPGWRQFMSRRYSTAWAPLSAVRNGCASGGRGAVGSPRPNPTSLSLITPWDYVEIAECEPKVPILIIFNRLGLQIGLVFELCLSCRVVLLQICRSRSCDPGRSCGPRPPRSKASVQTKLESRLKSVRCPEEFAAAHRRPGFNGLSGRARVGIWNSSRAFAPASPQG